MKSRDWLRLFRAQTAPATILLIMVPYLTNRTLFSFETLVIGLFALLVHWISFGHNSLMDTAMGYDRSDPSKSHHPLVAGRISITAAHNVIHWGLCGLSVFAILISLYFSPNPIFAVISIFLWFVFGYAYNSGLSKESLLSFLPISICFTAMGVWGWFLSHYILDSLGWLLLGYFFMTVLFQISWSGHLKELEVKERSNILIKMGAGIERTVRVHGGSPHEERRFVPGKSWFYGYSVKVVNLSFAFFLWTLTYDLVRLVILLLFSVLIVTMLHLLITTRPYIREKELRKMSLMEIFTIYMPIPLVLPWLEAIILMLFGVAYFILMNKLLWGTDYPRV